MPKYHFALLQEVVDRDKCIIDMDTYKNQVIKREMRIDFICNCGKHGTKSLLMLYEKTGGICKSCTTYRMTQKRQKTCLEKYGVENPLQAKEVRQKMKETCLEKYGVENPFQADEVKQKIKDTWLEKYGVEHPLQADEVKQKGRYTCLEKYGVEYALQADEVKQKSKATCLEKYGVENPSQAEEVNQKKKETCLEKYGVENPMQVEEVRQKSKMTCLEKYGVEHPMQNAEFAQSQSKNAYKLKTFTFPCGAQRLVQGYEHFALQLLIDLNYTSDQIETERNKVPEIGYEITERRCRYYPDIYIPSENKIIEVKSTWTYKKKEEKNLAKEQACKDAGYLFEFWVFDGKGNKLESIDIASTCQSIHY
jgi:glucan-binding YG repeat protein